MAELAQPIGEATLHPLNQGFIWRPTARTGRRLLDDCQIDAFDRQGFFRLDQALTADVLVAVTAAIDPLEAAQTELVHSRGGRFVLSAAETISFTAHLVTRSPVLADFARHPALKALCHDLIGPDVRLYWDQAVYKKSGKPAEFPWHQDNGYTFVEPQQYLTCWIPLVDVDEESGCPWIAPGRHLQGTFQHWLTALGLKCLDAVPDAVPVPARAGDIVVFSSLAPHRTGPNLKPGTVRKAYILQYAPDGATGYPGGGASVRMDDPARQFTILSNGA